METSPTTATTTVGDNPELLELLKTTSPNADALRVRLGRRVAVLIPSLAETSQLVEPLNDGELRVAEQLDKLGDDWTVFIQPRLTMDLPDFVAVHSDYGVCAIEVKDWSPGKYRNSNGVVQRLHRSQWVDLDEHPKLQPYRYQSTIFEHHFAFPDDGETIVPCVRSLLILLNHPTRRARELMRAPNRARWSSVSVYGEEVLGDLERALIGPAPCAPPQRSLARLHASLCDGQPEFRLRVDLRLSDSAKDIAANPRGAKVRRVRGAAGSGKSVGVATRAARLAAEGKSVLVTCFNVTLPQYLRPLISAICNGPAAARVECIHFHGFRAALADGVRRQYDAILVDEGQDFELEWWNQLREHLVPGGEMLLVADDTQRIFNVPRWTDEQMKGAGFNGPWTTLRDSYRIPGDLVPVCRNFAERYLKGDSWIPEGVTPPCRPTYRRWLNVSTQKLSAAIAAEILELLDNGSIVESERDLTYLCMSHTVGEKVASLVEAEGREVHHLFAAADEDRQRRKRRFRPQAPGVKGSTVHSFKGWESRVLVIGIGPNDWDQRLAYVAMTRLKQSLDRPSAIVVVNSNPLLAGFQQIFENGVPLPPPQVGTTLAGLASV
jgi:hypothetical protein